MKKSIAFFDFDGTLTEADSFWEFILFSQPTAKIIWGGIRFSFTLVGLKLGFVSNANAKIKVLAFLFHGWEIEDFKAMSSSFAAKKISNLLRQGALERIEWHQQQGHEVCVVSASLEDYLEPWCQGLGIHCLATSLKNKDGKIIGEYGHPNCYGPEKVLRIREAYDLSNYDKVYAYGNSSGDQEMLELANFPFFRKLE